MTLSTKLSQLLGFKSQPATESVPAEQDVTESSSLQRVKSIAAKNKMTLLMSGIVVVIIGTLFLLRQITTSLRGLSIIPKNPNLSKTVKTAVDKSSLVSSIEAEINSKNLTGQAVDAEISYIAKRFVYKPMGQRVSNKVVDTSTVKTASSPAAPVALVPKATQQISQQQKRRTLKPVYSKQAKKQVIDSDPFNTVRIEEPIITENVYTSAAATSSTITKAEETRFIPAVVYGKQTIRTRSKVRFRTTEAVTFQGVYIPRNTILTAMAFLGSGRIQFQVPAQLIAGKKLPVDLMCVDRDYQTGIAYNYDYVDDNMRQVGGSTVNDVVNEATGYMRYGSTAGIIGGTAIRGISNAVTSGKRQRSMNQVEIMDGYGVFFKSTKNN